MTANPRTRVSAVWKPLTLASSLVWMSVVPAAAVFASSGPTVTPGSVMLTATNHTAPVGATVTFTASAQDPGGTPVYQWWVESPTGQWTDMQDYSTANTFSLATPSAGDYLVVVDVLDQAQAAAGDWSAAQTTLPRGVFVDSGVTVAAVASGAAGQAVTLTATASNIYDAVYQFWVEAPNGTWAQSGPYQASPTYMFTPSAAGAYRYVVYAKSPLAVNNPTGALESPVGLYTAWGAPARVTTSLATPTLVADGKTPDAVTVSVRDALGTEIPTFDGWIELSGSGPVTFPATGYYGTEAASSGNWYQVVDGTAIIPVTSSSTGGVTVTPDHLVTSAAFNVGNGGLATAPQVANVTYQGAGYTAVAPTATVLTLRAVPSALANNSVHSALVTVGLADASGVATTAGPGPDYVTLTLTGPGSFSATVSQTTEVVAIGSNTSATAVPVWDEVGISGTVTVAAAGSGLVSPPALAIPTYEAGVPAGLTVTATSQHGGVTTYTVRLVDQAGQTLTAGAASSGTITVTDNTLTLGAPGLTYGYGTNDATLATSPATLTGTAFSTPLAYGQATFAVSNPSGVAAVSPTIRVADPSLGDQGTAAYAYYTGQATQAVFTSTAMGVQTGSLAPGQSIAVTGRLEDQSGVAVRTADQPIWFRINAAANAPLYGYANPSNRFAGLSLVGMEEPAISPAVVRSAAVATPIEAYNAMESATGYVPTLSGDVNGVVLLPNGVGQVGNEYETFTNASGQATIDVTVPSSDTAYQAFQLGVATSAYGQSPQSSVSGTWAPSPVYAVVSPTYEESSLSSVWGHFESGGVFQPQSAPYGTGRVAAGSLLTVEVGAQNSLQQPLTLQSIGPFAPVSGTLNVFDEWLITSSNPSVVRIPLATSTALSFTGTFGVNDGVTRVPGTNNEWLVNTWTAATGSVLFDFSQGTEALATAVGTATLTIQDVSNPAMPSTTTTVTVVPAQPAQYPQLQLDGQLISVTNPVTLKANQPQELMVVNQDTAGNPMPVVATETPLATTGLSLPDLPSGEQWDNSKGAPISSITIPVGQTSAPVWLVSSSGAVLGGVGSVGQFSVGPFIPAPPGFLDPVDFITVENSWGEPLPNTAVQAEGSGFVTLVFNPAASSTSLSSTSFSVVSSNTEGVMYDWFPGNGGTIESIQNSSVSAAIPSNVFP